MHINIVSLFRAKQETASPTVTNVILAHPIAMWGNDQVTYEGNARVLA